MTSFMKSEEDGNDNYKRWSYEDLQHRRRMQLQMDFQSKQRNHRLNRAAWLQHRWLEISEQERRAHLHNQKLMQDFQRAQDTLDDMVARTEAMNTIRVQYEKYLEENFPRWQQKLKDKRLSEQSKRLQQHLKDYVQQMEENEGIKMENTSDIRTHPLSSISADPSQPPASQNLPYTNQTWKGHPSLDGKRNAESWIHNSHDPGFPSTWLTDSQPLNPGPQNNIPKDHKNLQNIQALNHSLPPYYNLLHQSHPTEQHKSPSMDYGWQNSWTAAKHGLMPATHFTPAGASWPRLPVVNPMVWEMMNVLQPSEEKVQCNVIEKDNERGGILNPTVEKSQRLQQKKKGKACDLPSELDCRPVRLSVNHDSSESSAGEAQASGIQDKRKKRRDGTQTQSTGSQSSSTISQNAPLVASDSQSDSKKSKKHHKPSRKANQNTSKESIIKEKNVGIVTPSEGEEEEDKEEERSIQEAPPSSPSSGKKEETERFNMKNFDGTKEVHTDEGDGSNDLTEEERGEDEEGRGGQEKAELDKEAQKDDEEESKKEVMKGHGIEPSDGEETIDKGDERQKNSSEKEESISHDIADSDGEEEVEITEGEDEQENSSQDEDKEARKKQRTTNESVKNVKDENEDQEDDENINTSEKDIHNSLKELYAEDTEDEEVYNEEIEDDTDDDDNGEDEVVVEKAYSWSRVPLDDQSKYHDEDSEDIEGLLNPQVGSPKQQVDGVKNTDQSNDLTSDSEEEDLPKKTVPATTNEPEETDDEFDHFYD